MYDVFGGMKLIGNFDEVNDSRNEFEIGVSREAKSRYLLVAHLQGGRYLLLLVI